VAASPRQSEPAVLPRLYVICDADACAAAGWPLTDFAAACIEGGAALLQVRAKQAASREFLDTAIAIVERAAQAGASVIINDRADIARLSGAAGVHVGQDDLPPSAVRRIVGDAAVVGLSTHTREQIEQATREPVSYLAIGPVFGTSTKATGYDAVGIERVREAARIGASAGRPVVAIGGITIDTAPDVIAAGAASVAVISDLLTASPTARVRAYLDRLAYV
jgi:thiamine-phosphate pyrophosphorylase